MGIEDIQPEQKWRLINIVNRPDIVVRSVDRYSNIVYWCYDNENRPNESAVDYFLKTFKRVE